MSSLAISPGTFTTSTLGFVMQLTPTGYSYGGVAPTVTLTGGTGASVLSVSTTGLVAFIPGTLAGSIDVYDGTAHATMTIIAPAASVVSTPAATTTSFSVPGTIMNGAYPGMVGRTLQWGSGSANPGYSGIIVAQEVIGTIVTFFCYPKMMNAPGINDIPVIT